MDVGDVIDVIIIAVIAIIVIVIIVIIVIVIVIIVIVIVIIVIVIIVIVVVVIITTSIGIGIEPGVIRGARGRSRGETSRAAGCIATTSGTSMTTKQLAGARHRCRVRAS